MLKSKLCNYSDAYILVKRTITVIGQRANCAAIVADRNSDKKICTNCASFTNCISETNIIQKDNSMGLDIIMSMYNLMKQSDNLAKALNNLWQYSRDESDDENITDSQSLKFKSRLTKKHW